MKKTIIAATIMLFAYATGNAQTTNQNQQPRKNITGQDSTSRHRQPRMNPTDTGRKWNNVAPTNKNGTVKPQGVNPDSTRPTGTPPNNMMK